ncbi:MAG: DHHW family protein [Thermoflexibacter sp.]|uniref:DHHW protein n=1 Tax=Thermoflexibacter ruber TaxID=1003 RepID=A0A1I2ITT7_9BACT|nr:DHHW family protein [Thermoflexibacter ruber]SFF45679.1 DHHW protein [Thermoflexibacter ruber]
MKKYAQLIHSFLFGMLLTVLGVLLWGLPKKNISEREKRILTQLPAFNFNTLATGLYMDSLDAFTADHFPARDFFLTISDSLKSLRGIQQESKKVYTSLPSVDALADEDDSLQTFKDTEQVRNTKGLVVARGQAFHVFTNEQSLASDFAAVLNLYPVKIKSSRFFCVIAPTVGSYKMPDEYAAYATKESENIREIYQKLRKIKGVEVDSILRSHANEYIFYRTDHHWTGLGAYYAYVAFCEQAQLQPIDLAAMPKRAVEGAFLGTHFLKTNDASLKATPDTVFYWIPPVEEIAQKWSNGEMQPTPSLKVNNIEKNRYLVFLGGDEGLMRLFSKNVKNKKTALVIKNSYGNPFVLYLTANYEQVWVVDYRYFKGNLLEIFQQYKVDDIIFMGGIFAANEPTHIKKIKKILR